MTKQTLNGPGGLFVELNTADSDTPAMVYHRRHRNLSSTWDCATGEGMLDDQIDLSPAQQQWLESLRDKVEEAFSIARKDHPEYQ
jgi:hypothetical protein